MKFEKSIPDSECEAQFKCKSISYKDGNREDLKLLLLFQGRRARIEKKLEKKYPSMDKMGD
jgi:hypothetical protein